VFDGGWGLIWTHLGSPELPQAHFDSFEFTWTHLDTLGSLGIAWTHLGPLGLT
jgi:hypothetical protein